MNLKLITKKHIEFNMKFQSKNTEIIFSYKMDLIYLCIYLFICFDCLFKSESWHISAKLKTFRYLLELVRYEMWFYLIFSPGGKIQKPGAKVCIAFNLILFIYKRNKWDDKEIMFVVFLFYIPVGFEIKICELF